ncbi:unnamed protein product [Notodromas monacha]|uniref:Protein PET117 homolog, mitochondrial n=1 Tax=Notodromas monacha TaxID=399045 RepID=A0A7R9GBS9_9CRUS|nr:unnamed protein product [Notodromas monacha]CAG0916848.1 unnamed protein product [Notodromas monacha]
MISTLTAAKAALAVSLVISGAIIGSVHYKQQLDRSRMHDGIIRDVERQQRRKIENTYRLQEQRELAKVLRNQDEDEINAGRSE